VIGVVVLAQLQQLLDCCDGEVARWRQTSSPLGIFLDKVGHYSAESLIPIGLGVRAAGGLDGLPDGYGWTTIGALLALVVILNKALNDMVHVSRMNAGLPRMTDDEATTAPRIRGLARLRRLARYVPFHRLYHSVELSLLALAAAIVDAFVGGVMQQVRVREAEKTTVASGHKISWPRRMAMAATIAAAVFGATLARRPAQPLSVDMSPIPRAALVTKPVVASYDSQNATIVEVPTDSDDVKIVMIFDENLPADL